MYGCGWWEWVESMGVVSRMKVWVESMGVVAMRYIDFINTYPYSSCICSLLLHTIRNV